MNIEEIKDPYCLWIETPTGVLAVIGSIAEICNRRGISPSLTYEELKKKASEIVDNENTQLITMKEFLERKVKMEKIGKHLTIL